MPDRSSTRKRIRASTKQPATRKSAEKDAAEHVAFAGLKFGPWPDCVPGHADFHEHDDYSAALRDRCCSPASFASSCRNSSSVRSLSRRVTSRLTDCGARPNARSATSEAARMRHDHGTESVFHRADQHADRAFADRPHELDRLDRAFVELTRLAPRTWPAAATRHFDFL